MTTSGKQTRRMGARSRKMLMRVLRIIESKLSQKWTEKSGGGAQPLWGFRHRGPIAMNTSGANRCTNRGVFLVCVSYRVTSSRRKAVLAAFASEMRQVMLKKAK